jgi:predicted transposase YbfD/YdcC
LVGYSDFPYLEQVFCLHRHTTDLKGTELRSECVYGVTSLSTTKAGPAQLLDFNRNHWSIENKVHWVRDVTFDEDRSRVRKKAGPQVMASLRNLAISMLRMAGADNVAEALRSCSWNRGRPLRLIGIAPA